MKYAAEIDMVMEDNLPAISYQIRDRNSAADGEVLDKRDPETWRPVDLTGCTVHVDIRERGTETVIESLNASIITPLSGKVLLVIADAIFKESSGSYELETVVTTGASLQQTVYDLTRINVRSRVKVTV